MNAMQKHGVKGIALAVMAIAVLAFYGGSVLAGEHGGHGGSGGPGGHDGHGRPSWNGGHGGSGGGVFFGFGRSFPAPIYRPMPIVCAPSQVVVIPAPAPVVTVPAPEIITYSNGMIVRRCYSVVNGVVVSQDTIVQSAPIIQPVTIVQQPATPTWVNVLNGLRVAVRW